VNDGAARTDSSSVATPAIEVRDLRKRYGDRAVVDGLSFSVAAGEVFALLGPNGAGKTTTVEILEGYRRPDGGQARVLGLDPRHQAHHLRPRIGLMLQEGGVYPQARPGEILTLFASFYAAPDDPARLLTLVGLNEARRTPYRRLSGGQKQRLSLALALVGRPELVFLDEPTAGMDPQARRATWEVIRSLRAGGVTVLLTTHAMDEAEQLADRVAIINRGRLAAIGDLAALRGAADATMRVTADADLPPDALASLPSARRVHHAGPGRCLIETDAPAALLVEITTWAAQRGILLRRLTSNEQ
jgi:ABC-2 type transport system ATP-binding protein